jgi:magnesium-transporting ATPase (P-type)
MPIRNIKLDIEDFKALFEDLKLFLRAIFTMMLVFFIVFRSIIYLFPSSSPLSPLYASFLGTMFYTLPMFVLGLIGYIIMSISRKHIVEGFVAKKEVRYGKDRGGYWLVINHVEYKVNKKFWKKMDIDMEVRLHKSNFFYYFIRGEIIS